MVFIIQIYYNNISQRSAHGKASSQRPPSQPRRAAASADVTAASNDVIPASNDVIPASNDVIPASAAKWRTSIRLTDSAILANSFRISLSRPASSALLLLACQKGSRFHNWNLKTYK